MDTKNPSAEENEYFWQDLLQLLEAGDLVPIIGPEASSAPQNGSHISLYRLVAERLQREKGLSCELRPGYELSDVSCELLNDKRLYSLVNATLRSEIERLATSYSLTEGNARKNGPSDLELLRAPLERLATISKFEVFVSTTCDTLLHDALTRKRKVDPEAVITFAQQLSDKRWKDYPDQLQEGAVGMVYLFGQASPAGAFALHEEDMLECVYQLEQHRHSDYMNMMNVLCDRSLLFIGCPLSDWLGRLLLRISNRERLTGKPKKVVFIVIPPEATDHNLTGFIKKFCDPWVQVCYLHPSAFIEELARRWGEKHTDEVAAQEARRVIFISYASEDAKAATELFRQCLARKIASRDEVWLDEKGGLECGDLYEQKIRQLVTNECSIFIPLISSNTAGREARSFFRKEWGWAASRAEEAQYGAGRSGGNFLIFPLIIDQPGPGEDTAMRSRVSKLLKGEAPAVQEQFGKATVKEAAGGVLSKDLATTLKNKMATLPDRRA